MKSLLFLALSAMAAASVWAKPTILLIAGPASHAPGEHEHPAGCELLARHLSQSNIDVTAEVSLGWPDDPARVATADTLVIYSDGLEQHIANGHLEALRKRHAGLGKGLAILHWATEPSAGELATFLNESIGGRFEAGWSVNPIWTLTSPIIAGHEATRGVGTFELEEEFYYHMRLRPEAKALLSAHPPESSLGADGPRSGNAAVRKALADGEAQVLAWVVENTTGSRGFGFTGGHFHRNWANEDYRQLVLNAIVWTAKVEIPAGGVTSTVQATPANATIEMAIARGDLEDVKLHVATNPACLTPQDAAARAPLDLAILRNQNEIAMYLLAAGANPDTLDRSNRTAVHSAVARNNPAVITALLKAGANPNVRDKSGWTPLHHAAAKNQLETTRALLAGGADPKILSELGGTPLHEAATGGSRELLQLLLAHDVDPSIKSKQGVTALDLAREYKNQAAIEVLAK